MRPRAIAMAGPIGLGVASTVSRAARARVRRAGRPPRRPPPRPGRAWAIFVALTALLSWTTAGLLPPPASAAPGLAGVLDAALWYAAVMGWQPLVAARLVRWATDDDGDSAVRAAPFADVLMAVAIALGCAVAAGAVAIATGEPRAAAPVTTAPVAGPVVAAVIVLWLQAMTEEYGWRGAPLGWASAAWGARPGLIVHGASWGLWYAPLFLRVGGLDRASAQAAAGFVVTCAALGVVLGWLRLRSRSLVPPVVANLVLTLAAGLPFVLSGDAGVRDAVLRWPGWPVLGAVASVVLVWRRRELEARRPPVG